MAAVFSVSVRVILARLAEARGETVPINNQAATGGSVLLPPVHQQIEAGVIDVVQRFEMNMQIAPRWHGFEAVRQARQPQKRGGAFEEQRRASTPWFVFDSHFKVRERG